MRPWVLWPAFGCQRYTEQERRRERTLDDLAAKLVLLSVPARKDLSLGGEGEEVIVAGSDLHDRVRLEVLQRDRLELGLRRSLDAIESEQSFARLRLALACSSFEPEEWTHAERSPAAKLSLVTDGERDAVPCGDTDGLESLLDETLDGHRLRLELLRLDARDVGVAT